MSLFVFLCLRVTKKSTLIFFPVVTAFQSCRLRKEVAFWCLGTAASILELSRILGLCELAYVDYKCGAKNKLQEPTASALPCSATHGRCDSRVQSAANP